jgi:LuxR family maltose regulon positive regulatory protein
MPPVRITDPTQSAAEAPWAPPPIPGLVTRPDLVRRLATASEGSRLVVVSAPAGYGKTTLLAEWARAAGAPAAWLTLRHEHRSPRRLHADLAAARDARGAAVLVLDDVDAAASPETVAALRALIGELPSGSRVAVGCRADPGLLPARRLLDGGTARLTAVDLAFDAGEARALLAGRGIAVTDAALDHLMHRTEGWPAGLALAALRIAGAPDAEAAALAFAGDDRLVADYLRETVLDALPPATLAFLTRASVLDRLTGPVCDAVLGEPGSGELLCALERQNVPLVPLDDRREAFRLHRLLGDMLRAELLRREPDAAVDLHRRAGAWHEAADDHAGAVRHALASGEAARAERLAWAAFPAALTRGEVGGLRAMLERFGVDAVARSAPLSLMAAWCDAEGRGDLTGHHLASAERAPAPADAGIAATVAVAMTTLRAMLARTGPAAMARDAAAAYAAASDDGPWRAWTRFLEGVALLLDGDSGAARVPLEEGVERAGRLAPSVHALCLAQLALLLIDDEEDVRALMLARRARAVVEEWGLGSQASAALTYVACGLANARCGRAAEARDDLRDARRVLSDAGDACAWLAVQARVAAARVGIAVGDEAAAREALAECERFLGDLVDVPLLREAVEDLRRHVQPVPEGDAACLSSITAAETRVLLLLPTHHSFREIGDLLFLSRFTVKSHAHALYRKLGVSSRGEAVERARALRILTRP